MRRADLMPVAPGDEIVATYPRGLSRRCRVRLLSGDTLIVAQFAYRRNEEPLPGFCACGASLQGQWLGWDGHQDVYATIVHPAGCGVGWQETPECVYHLKLDDLASVTPALSAVV